MECGRQHGSRSPQIRDLPFDRIPRQPDTFLRYVNFMPEVSSFYRHPPAVEALAKAADETLAGAYPRREVAEILRRQNEAFGTADPVRRAIAELENEGSVAVLTGQQVGLFTGPSLAVYKALTAVRMCAELKRFGVTAVPVFWMASDDHDLEEITRLVIAEPGSETQAVDARTALFGARNLPAAPVGSISLPDSIQGLAAMYASSLAGWEWSEEIKSQLVSCCIPGVTFSDAFGRLMSRLFRDRGLILFDPRDPGAKRLVAPVIRKALAEAQPLQRRLQARIAELKKSGLGIQVAVPDEATLVFLETEGERRLLRRGKSGFAWKGSHRRIREEEMLALLNRAAERFSPGVLLRPLVQDHLFPTIAYVGGPAEISYFAQIEPLYGFYGRPMPVVWPRSSFTVLDAKSCAALSDYGLKVEDVFKGARHMIHRILGLRCDRPQSLLQEIERQADHDIRQLKPFLMATDATLAPASDTVRRKVLHRLSSLRTKFLHYEMRRNTALMDQVLQLQSLCFPNGNLQERELGIHPLLARLGPSLLDTLYEAIEVDHFTHRVLCL